MRSLKLLFSRRWTCIKYKIGDKVRRYLVDIEQVVLTDVALFADDEKEVWSCIFALAGLTNDREGRGQKVFCKQFWMAGRKVLGSTDPASASACPLLLADDEAPLPDGTGETLQEAWFDKHTFHLNGSRFVADGLFSNMYRRLRSKPRKLEPAMLEKIRLQSRPH